MFAGQSTDMLACLEAGGVGAICPLGALMPVTARRLADEYRAGIESAVKAAAEKIARGGSLTLPESGGPSATGVQHQGVKEALVAISVIKSAATRDPGAPQSEAWKQRMRELGKELAEL
jgi:dihydrodipicolinate synthase/N-acetylneuraminate lyase